MKMKYLKELCLVVGSSAMFIGPAVADQQILDDLIVDGSICAGLDCVNGESFGFDTLRLKENNLRIKFQDTSTSASFPTNDWQLTANDSSNGGQNKFSIDDIDGGRTPFTIEASAPSHSLYVEDGGRVGFGTNTPVVNLHVKEGNTPTLRLEQDGSQGFTPQTWDVAGNESNFFVRDATNGSTLPFKIKPSAPNNALVIDADGDIGLGVLSPTASFQINGSDGSTSALIKETNATVSERIMLDIENNGGSQIEFEDTGTSTQWQMGSRNGNNDFEITRAGSGTVEFLISASTKDVTITGNLFTAGTTCGGGCDLVFTEQYDLPTIEEHNAKMWEKGYLPTVGPTIENEPINLTDKTGRMLNELEKAHIYIGQLNNRLAEKEDVIENLVKRLENLESKL